MRAYAQDMELLLLGLVLELAAGEGWDWLKGKLRPSETNWAQSMASRLASLSGLGLTVDQVAGLARWLERGDVFAVLAAVEPSATAATVDALVAPLANELGPPCVQTRELAVALVAITIEELVNAAEPGLMATLSSYRQLSLGIQALKDGQAVIYERVEEVLAAVKTTASLPEEQLRTLAPPVRQLLEELHSSNAPLAGVVLQWVVGTPEQQAANMKSLVDKPPAFLTEALSRLAWETVGETAMHRDAHEHSSRAFETAASLDPRERTRLLARAAMLAYETGDSARAVELVANALDDASSPEASFAQAVQKIVTGERDGLVEVCESALRDGSQEQALLYSWRGNALALDGRHDEALDAFREAVANLPDYAGPRINLAAILVARAVDEPTADRLANLHEALTLALEAKALREAWFGDPSEAVAVACEAAFSMGDLQRVLELASSLGPSVSPAVADARRLIALASVVENSPISQHAGSEFETEFFSAVSLARDPERKADAADAFRRAASTAQDRSELTTALYGLANLGELPLEGIDEVRENDPDLALTLEALAMLRSGRVSEAVGLLRPLASRQRLAARVLADAYVEADRQTEAVEVLKRAGLQFGDADMAIDACRLLVVAGDLDEAERIALSQLQSTPPGQGARELRRALFEIAVRRNDPSGVERIASQALAQGDTDETIWWTRVEALYRLGRFRDAWRVLTREPAHRPTSEREARLFLQVQARADPSAFDAALDIMDRFADSHDVIATGIVLFFTLDREATVDDGQLGRFHGHLDQFTNRYPDSHVIRRETVTPDDPDQLLSEVRQLLQPDAKRDEARQELADRAVAGQMPVGFAANALGRRYVDVVIVPGILPFVSISADESVLREEVSLAATSLDGPIVADLSAVVVGSHVRLLWPRIVGAFSIVHFVEAEFQQIDVAAVTRMPVGYMQWDYDSGTPQLTSFSDDDMSAMKEQLAWIRARAGALSPFGGDVSAALASLGDAAEGTWAEALGAASTLGVPLLCDDVALAALARSQGVKSFSSYAVLLALEERGDLGAKDLSAADGLLYLAHASDLPKTPAELVRLGGDLDAPLRARLHPLTRPYFWLSNGGLEAFRELLTQLPTTDPAALSAALQSGVLGVMRSRLAGTGETAAAALFVTVILLVRPTPEVAAELVEATRRACHAVGARDPLPALAGELHDVVANASSPAAATAFTTHVFGALSDEDRLVVTRRILQADT
jgi:tetratricopeptide (TPR) repeat protein